MDTSQDNLKNGKAKTCKILGISAFSGTLGAFFRTRIQFREANLCTARRRPFCLFTATSLNRKPVAAAFKHYPQRSITDKLMARCT